MHTSSFIKQVLAQSERFSNVIAACKDLLQTSEIASEAKNYLNGRVTTNYQDKIGFGYFPADSDIDILIKMVGSQTLLKSGLMYPDKENPMAMRGLLSQHNLIMPIRDDYGNIVALVGRSILPEEDQKKLDIQKYKYTNGYRKSSNLFGLCYAKKAIRKSHNVILVEGQIDCITCQSRGFHNTVALGGSSMSDYQMYLLMKCARNLKVNLLLDNDDAGRKGQQKIIDRFFRNVTINKVDLPSEYKDVDEYLHKSKDYSVLTQLF